MFTSRAEAPEHADTGLQKHFDWRSVVASAISSPIGELLADSLTPQTRELVGQDFSMKAGKNLVRGIATQVTRVAVYGKGKLDFAQIAADAFGNAIGDSLAGAGRSGGVPVSTNANVADIASYHKQRTMGNMNRAAPVVIALKRSPGYEDVHPELVIEDAMQPEWSYKFLRDEGAAVIIAIDRPVDYERSSASGMAKEAVRPTWPSWSLVKK